jgi:hypothetical protein
MSKILHLFSYLRWRYIGNGALRAIKDIDLTKYDSGYVIKTVAMDENVAVLLLSTQETACKISQVVDNSYTPKWLTCPIACNTIERELVSPPTKAERLLGIRFSDKVAMEKHNMSTKMKARIKSVKEEAIELEKSRIIKEYNQQCAIKLAENPEVGSRRKIQFITWLKLILVLGAALFILDLCWRILELLINSLCFMIGIFIIIIIVGLHWLSWD